MTKATEIIMQVSKGDITVEQANAALKKQNAGFVLDPGKVTLTDEERAGAVVSDDPTKVTGWGLVSGMYGTFKIHVERGKFPYNTALGSGNSNFYIGGRVYAVEGDHIEVLK